MNHIIFKHGAVENIKLKFLISLTWEVSQHSSTLYYITWSMLSSNFMFLSKVLLLEKVGDQCRQRSYKEMQASTSYSICLIIRRLLATFAVFKKNLIVSYIRNDAFVIFNCFNSFFTWSHNHKAWWKAIQPQKKLYVYKYFLREHVKLSVAFVIIDVSGVESITTHFNPGVSN